MNYLITTKVGMTRVFDATGRAVPVTALQVEPTVVVQRKTVEKDGYSAIQCGAIAHRHPGKPLQGHAKQLPFTPRELHEVLVDAEADYQVGQMLDLSQFAKGDAIKLVATSKGKGFAGVIKRHNFSRGPETHGSDHHRAPGSIGSMFPQHVTKGRRMPGHMGNDRVTVRGVEVVDIFPEQNLLLVKGPVPGVPGGIVQVIGA